jgi:hypothetical protein
VQISELLLMLQHEVQKTFDFVDEARAEFAGRPDASVLHIALERVEIELPITLAGRDGVFDPKPFRGLPKSIRRLQVPYTPRAALERGYVPRKPMAGKFVEAEIIGLAEGADDRVDKERIGRIKVVLRPIIK